MTAIVMAIVAKVPIERLRRETGPEARRFATSAIHAHAMMPGPQETRGGIRFRALGSTPA
ncbi:hypothetical protein OCJ37_02940 [Xanthomonas sp. AM6]|uniref:hypothetical protein n=1 Tax=Xanthomonas sp. AM6 TaxID=2982531 RepID=UPI0021DB5585|nr:hypothetical protein [Xanthomonas sp. AM6]UYB52937.1 hypothetical protein OCJ37_02940 [Xanthomonas sp. AM6]